ncbi:MAG: hypothetical protein OXC37_04205 [Bdellovibrionaceae bacterium]|nr:hypothetical protein [Pseudobdellovibrionaceae bacterium]
MGAIKFPKKLFLLAPFIFLFCQPLSAQIFKNSYVSFELPDSWKCAPFGTNWVCHDSLQEKSVEALITSTAKIAGSLDTREQYLDYLKQEKMWLTKQKEQITSQKLQEAKEVFINKYPWVDGTHKNSEVKSYISRYVGTVCCQDSSSQLGILIVLSAHEDHYKKYSPIFIKAINSLKVLDIEKAIVKVRAEEARSNADNMSDYIGQITDGEEELMDGDTSLGLNLSPLNLSLMALALLALYFAFLLRKKRKQARRRHHKRRK